MKTLWKTIKETATTFKGWVSILISFLILSGVPIIVVGHLINNSWVYGVGYGVFAFYLAPNGVAIFGVVVLAPLISKLIGGKNGYKKRSESR